MILRVSNLNIYGNFWIVTVRNSYFDIHFPIYLCMVRMICSLMLFFHRTRVKEQKNSIIYGFWIFKIFRGRLVFFYYVISSVFYSSTFTKRAHGNKNFNRYSICLHVHYCSDKVGHSCMTLIESRAITDLC